MDGEYANGGETRAAFARTLPALKRDGSNVLVVGEDVTAVHEVACRELCGCGDSDGDDGDESAIDRSRYRVLVTDRADRPSNESAPSGTVRWIEYATEADGDPSVGDTQYAGCSDRLEALGIEIIETIDEFDADADGLAPAELRVCVDSPMPLFRAYDAERVFRLLHATTAAIEHVNGMGHVHLPLAPDHETVALLEPLFDAVVELRERAGKYEQRWRLRERRTRTEWLSL
ncbi:DUF7504 family protein [Halopiger xanaduensis]|nr:hypothetical protein [Halopiger xanaduensis]